jgi:serine/threonine protein kinase
MSEDTGPLDFWEEWRVVRLLNVGGCAEVWQIENKDSGEFIALKLFKNEAWVDEHYTHELAACRELLQLGLLLRCEDLIVEHPMQRSVEHRALMLEYRAGPDLFDWLSSPRNNVPDFISQPTQVWDLLRACCEELRRFHSAGLTHGDVKPENWIVCKEASFRTMQLVDFGYCQPSSEPLRHRFVGTIGYTAPEWLPQHINYSAPLAQSLDIFALGSTMFALLTAAPVYDQVGAARHEWFDVQSEFYPDDPALEALLRRMVSTEPAERPTCAEILRIATAHCK